MARGTEECFRSFRQATGFKETLSCFEDLCQTVAVNPKDEGLFRELRMKLQCSDAKVLWQCLETRHSHSEYYNSDNQMACSGKPVLIVGAGPCGLRMAIECALLGAQVNVIDMRQYITRNNVLHLWPFLIEDIKGIGGKVFNPKFCVSSINHVSIRCLQVMLLKIALLIGVKVYTPVKFLNICEPDQKRGWHVNVSPENHCINDLDFEFIVGASGLNHSLSDIPRKTARGKLAIAITVNFVNKHTRNDAKVQEIGGLSFLYGQEFFRDVKEKTGADLENIVYFKDDTHYFVMTVRKASLLKTGVLKCDNPDAKVLLSKENIDTENLKSLARNVAITSTKNQLPCQEFELNHYGKEDIAIFDFTSRTTCSNSCFVKVKDGHTLVQCVVGDSLLQPFWPQGTGCARGFMSVFDAAWLIRSWCMNDSLDISSKLSIIAQRENIYKMLTYTAPESRPHVIRKYTIDPTTRYTRIQQSVTPEQVSHLLYVADSPGSETLATKSSSVEKHLEDSVKDDCVATNLDNSESTCIEPVIDSFENFEDNSVKPRNIGLDLADATHAHCVTDNPFIDDTGVSSSQSAEEFPIKTDWTLLLESTNLSMYKDSFLKTSNVEPVYICNESNHEIPASSYTADTSMFDDEIEDSNPESMFDDEIDDSNHKSMFDDEIEDSDPVFAEGKSTIVESELLGIEQMPVISVKQPLLLKSQTQQNIEELPHSNDATYEYDARKLSSDSRMSKSFSPALANLLFKDSDACITTVDLSNDYYGNSDNQRNDHVDVTMDNSPLKDKTFSPRLISLLAEDDSQYTCFNDCGENVNNLKTNESDNMPIFEGVAKMMNIFSSEA